MGPTTREIVSKLSPVYWTPLSGFEASVARNLVQYGQVEILCPLGGSEFFRLIGGGSNA